MGMKPQAEKLFRHYLARHPDHPEALNNLGCALRDQERFDEAVETLRPAILDNPGDIQLWNTMGTVMAEQGDYANAEVFFSEALRLAPDFYKSRYNLGNARLILGDAEGALEACDAALPFADMEDERQMMLLSRATILMALGRIGEGWDVYEARVHPKFADTTDYLFDRPKWAPGDDLAGQALLVVGEQGLGDEVLCANLLPDVIERLGPTGRLTLAVEPRLTPIFRRTYPQARVVAHATYLVSGRTVRFSPELQGKLDDVDLWAPMGSLLREFRRTLEAFPDRPAFIAPDPERVAHWRAVLAAEAPAGPKIGLLWKSAIRKDARHRYFSPFDAWAPVLTVPGASFVNLQYGDCAAELAIAERDLGVRIWTPPGIDLKQDLDDVAALGAALDLVVGFSNASFNLAAAAGAPAWLVSTPGSWPRLGTLRYPWYPQARVFLAPAFGAWESVMGEMGEALAAYVAGKER
jgi:tetratricopeptide (TPR) repeat protein